MALDARGFLMLPCTCDVGMCTLQPNCRQQRNQMAQIDEGPRTKRERIERLRKRLAEASTHQRLADVLKGMLDLLADEL